MTVSIIIPTYNGAAKIAGILDSLILQTIKDFEVIVLIDGSTDNTVEIVKAYSDRLNLRMFSRNNGGRASARNEGAQCGKDGLLIFFDDDLELNNRCVETHLNHHIKYSESILNCGPLTNPAWAVNDFVKYRIWLEAQWVNGFTEGTVKITLDNFLFSSANFSLPTHLFQKLQGFNNVLTDSEDEEFAKRALRQGVNIYYNHEGYAWHRDTTSIIKYTLRQREYLKSKRQNQLLGFSVIFDKKISWSKHILYKIISQPLYLYLIDNFNIFFIIPRQYRFRFYSALIWSLAALYPDKKI